MGTGSRFVGGDGDDAFYVTKSGNNTLTGGEGADRFWIADAEIPESANVITDFDLSEDVIGVAGLNIGFNDLSITQVEGDSSISIDGSDLAILQDVDITTLSADSFAFA